MTSTRNFPCTQCSKVFATRSNLKRHMENPNIHNIPYIRSRDQKRWKGHSKKVVSKEETTERMRRWRAENREKNRQNDLRCRVYRLARQKFGSPDSLEKQQFVLEEIARRLGRRMLMEQHKIKQEASVAAAAAAAVQNPVGFPNALDVDHADLPFYSAPQQKIELPCLWRRDSSSSSSNNSNSTITSSSSTCSSSASSITSSPMMDNADLSLAPIDITTNTMTATATVRYVDQTKILDEFVGLVLDYAGHPSL
ncbi:hypothetical protein BX666DRAFT_1869390 [Dichotomocladium elegans]|nr:hypothetical protein BX666DRAFT_1869390 [Dichotomocladium elegans]